MKESIKISNTVERKIDELGRIVIPIETRKKLHITNDDHLEISKSGKNIILKKLEKSTKKDRLQNMKITLDNEIEINIDINKINDTIEESNNRVRTIDELGRIVIPLELREKLDIWEKDTMKICVKDNMIILIKKGYDRNSRKEYNINRNRRKSRQFGKKI